MSAHTPEPWVYGKTMDEHLRLILGGPEERYVCSVTIHQIPRYMGLGDEPEREANARLILAAPGLLRVLKHMRHRADTGRPITMGEVRAMDKIIAEAEEVV